jgi:hypothetical protein
MRNDGKKLQKWVLKNVGERRDSMDKKLVLIDWVDSCGVSPHWDFFSEKKNSIVRCQSVGWLLHDGKDAKTIVPHRGNVIEGEEQGCGDMTTPTKSIIKITTIYPLPSRKDKKS